MGGRRFIRSARSRTSFGDLAFPQKEAMPIRPLPSEELQANDGKQHVLQHVQNNSRASRQQLRPNRQVQLPLEIDINAVKPPDQQPHRHRGGKLARPRDGRGVEREVKVVRLAGAAVEGEVGVDVLVGAEVEDEDGAKEGGHRGVFRYEADEDVAGAEFLVGGVGEGREADGGEEAVECGGHEGWGYDD